MTGTVENITDLKIDKMAGPEIKEWREAQAWSQMKLAILLGVSLASVQNWERGITRPSPMAIKLIRELQVRVNHLGISEKN